MLGPEGSSSPKIDATDHLHGLERVNVWFAFTLLLKAEYLLSNGETGREANAVRWSWFAWKARCAEGAAGMDSTATSKACGFPSAHAGALVVQAFHSRAHLDS